MNIPALKCSKYKCSFSSKSWPGDHQVDTSLMTAATVVMPSIILFIASACEGTVQEKSGHDVHGCKANAGKALSSKNAYLSSVYAHFAVCLCLHLFAYGGHYCIN